MMFSLAFKRVSFVSLQEADLVKECMSESTAAVNSFKLYDRAKHVYSEAGRVLRFKQVCNEGNGYTSKVTFLYSESLSCFCFHYICHHHHHTIIVRYRCDIHLHHQKYHDRCHHHQQSSSLSMN